MPLPLSGEPAPPNNRLCWENKAEIEQNHATPKHTGGSVSYKLSFVFTGHELKFWNPHIHTLTLVGGVMLQ